MILKPRPFRKPRIGHWATKGLVGCWLFNEGSGNKVFDLSGNGNIGTLQNTAYFGAGKYGSAVILDGNSDYVLTGTVNHNIGTGDFTIVASVMNNTLSGTDTIWSNGTYVPSLLTKDGGELAIYWGTYKDSGYDLVAGIRYHIVLVRESGVFRFYVNGIQTKNTYSVGTSLTNATWQFGSSRSTGLEYWDGSIDYVNAYNRALSASEIALLYREPFCMFERDPIELWSAATLGAIPTGMAGAMTTNTRYWGW